jgi:hypothetical protein
LQIIKINESDKTFRLDEGAMEKILSDAQVKDKPVCVISVAGNKKYVRLVR